MHGIQLLIFVASLQGHERCNARAPPRHREGRGGAKGRGKGGGRRRVKNSTAGTMFRLPLAAALFWNIFFSDGAGATGPDIAPADPCCLDINLARAA